MKKFLAEFKEFALKGNVMDMAIGVIIGAAFGNIVKALTDSFINPLIGLVTGGAQKDPETGQILVSAGAWSVGGVEFTYGAFISAVVNFLIIALVLFLMLKAINGAAEKAKQLALKKAEEGKEDEPAPEDPADVALLKELVALMKESNPEAAKKVEEKRAEALKKAEKEAEEAK